MDADHHVPATAELWYWWENSGDANVALSGNCGASWCRLVTLPVRPSPITVARALDSARDGPGQVRVRGQGQRRTKWVPGLGEREGAAEEEIGKRDRGRGGSVGLKWVQGSGQEVGTRDPVLQERKGERQS